jgi:DNA-binding winged helix-turn-helix (wHTH) protein
MSKGSAAEIASAPAFSIDRPNQLLWRGDTPTKVPPKVFQLLSYLRDNPGRIIEYDELLDAVWPREFVQPEILKTYVKTIRRLLEDDAHSPRFIETRARCGYSFIGQLPDRCERGSPSPSRLVGRDEPLASLQTGWRAALGGQRHVMFVVGEAGIGKTRLIDEFVSRVDDGEIGVCRVDCAQAQHAAGGFSPVRELSLALAATTPATTSTADDEAAHTDAAERLCRQVEARASEQAMIVVVENVQWADVATIEALSRLAYARSPARLLLLASYRASMPNDPRCPGRTLMLDLLVHGAATELRLTALASEDVKRLVLLNSTGPMARGAIEAIDRYAGGNPLIVSLLVDRMVQQVRETGTSELTDMLSRHEHECEFLPDAVPDVIRHSLELQLRQLGERTRTVLECGSNSGFAFCAWGVSKVMNVPQIEVEELCRAMCGSDQLLRESGLYVFPDGSVTPVYSFRNRLYARLLLTSQSPARRDAVQQAFTEAVEGVWGDEVGSVALEMTERFEAVREWSRALHYAKLAVQNAQRLTSCTDAVSLLQRGLKLSDHLPQNRRASEKDFFLSRLSKLG